MALTSDDLNYLIFQYLAESGVKWRGFNLVVSRNYCGRKAFDSSHYACRLRSLRLRFWE